MFSLAASLVLGGVTVAFIALYRKFNRFTGYLEREGVPVVPKPARFWNYHLVNWKEWDLRCMMKNGSIWGWYEGTRAEICVAEPQLLKEILVRQFDAFEDRMQFAMADKHVSLFDARSDKWRTTRKALSPTFTSGKLKGEVYLLLKSMECNFGVLEGMFESIQGVVDEMLTHTGKALKRSPDGVVDIKPLFQCLSLDSIANCAFGVTTNSFVNPENDLFDTCIKSFADVSLSSLLESIVFFVGQHFEVLARYIDTYGAKNMEDLWQTTKSIVVRRQEPRGDFIDRLKKILDERLLSEDETYAQGIGFFLAGFETTSNTLSTFTYHLAKNQDIQDRLYAEVSQVLEKYDGRIDHDTISEMPYMDACLHENLRINNPVTRINRLCIKDCQVGRFHIKRGTLVYIPIWAIHHDPERYPDPDKFNPERFLRDDGISTFNNFDFLGFGAGPRQCIGMRFAIVEMKISMAKLISKFRILEDKKTKLDFDNGDILLLTYPSVKVKLEKRHQ